MTDPYKVLYKDGAWQVSEEILQRILDESGSDSEDDVDLDNIVSLGDHHDEEDENSEGPTDHDNDNRISEKQIEIDQAPINVWRTCQLEMHQLPVESNQPSLRNFVKSPLEYFTGYFNEEHFTDAARYTNVYYLQARGTELETTSQEIKRVYGISMMMGCVSYPRIKMYWQKGLRFEAIAGTMARSRFRNIRNSLHYVDINLTAADPSNSFWKIQPVINAVRDGCRSLPRNIDNYAVDEQMIPYTGRCPARQYVKNKPRPVGLKNFVVTTSKGLVVDFKIYQGDKTELGDRSLGLGPAVVLNLVETLPKGSFIYFDRYFTTVMSKLLDLGYRATETIMLNRLINVNFKLDKHMEKGESQEFVINDGKHDIAVVKWKDSKGVITLSTIAGTNPVTTVERWNKQQKTYQKLNCPAVVSQYNKNMGGVDLVDQMLEYYRSFIKTKKWTLKATTHLIDLAVVNSWMEYRLDCTICGVAKSQIKDL